MQTEEQKETIRKWIEALRSGEYKQGFGMLKHEGKYCCLGVLCEIKGAEYNEEMASFSFFLSELNGFIDHSGNVPNSVFKDWTGFEPLTKVILISMNDNGRHTFKDIANYIEKHVLNQQKVKSNANE